MMNAPKNDTIEAVRPGAKFRLDCLGLAIKLIQGLPMDKDARDGSAAIRIAEQFEEFIRNAPNPRTVDFNRSVKEIALNLLKEGDFGPFPPPSPPSSSEGQGS